MNSSLYFTPIIIIFVQFRVTFEAVLFARIFSIHLSAVIEQFHLWLASLYSMPKRTLGC